MKIMNEYTYHYIKKNKRHTISILVAITIASALLCSLCIFIYSYWHAKVTFAIDTKGYWHGELWQSISGDKLEGIIENPEIETVMTKGTWVTAQLTDTTRPYFLMRDADKNYWKDMDLRNNLMEGRFPEKEGEIVVSNLFFTENPSYNVGDTLTLPVGNRMLGDEILRTQAYQQDGEKFVATGTKTYIIVGILDVSGVSAYPGYVAMGYYDVANVSTSDELTVYMRLSNPRKVYDIMPEIAEAAGLQKDESGQYGIVYNTTLLELYGINEKGEANIQFIMIIAMTVVLILLVMGTFILIIYNAFSLSANNRIMELSVLKSIGATPRQIKYSVLYEGILLWFVQWPVGILIGYVFSLFIFSRVNEVLNVIENYSEMNVSFSWVVILFALTTSLITVLVSAYVPARKLSKIPAVEGINQDAGRVKKDKASLLRVFGIEGELAAKQFRANKKSLRIAVVSLSLCLILISSYINIISIYNLAESKNVELTNYDMSVNLNILDEPNSKMIQDIVSIQEVQDSVISRQVRTTTNITAEQESQEFSELGGFGDINTYKYNVVAEDDSYRIVVNLVGLEKESYQAYCNTIGVDSESFGNDNAAVGILQDSTYHIPSNSKELLRIPMLSLQTGDSIILKERVFDNMEGDYEFDIQIGAVTDISPGELKTNRYSALLILPMEQYQLITANFESDRELEASRMTVDLLVGDNNSTIVKEKITQICGAYLGSEDFSIWSLLDDKNNDALMQKAISIAVYAVAILIGIIGIINAFSTISNNLKIHKREYALLRSVGITPAGLNKILILEGLSFALKPLIISIPCILLICGFMLNITKTTWSEFLSVFQSGVTIVYTICVFAAIILAYWLSSRNIKQENIIDAIKNEIV